jgi:hypothetical protein
MAKGLWILWLGRLRQDTGWVVPNSDGDGLRRTAHAKAPAVMTTTMERMAALAAEELACVSRIKRFGKAAPDGADCVDAGR